MQALESAKQLVRISHIKAHAVISNEKDFLVFRESIDYYETINKFNN
jgi:hypothetical protein